MKGTSEMMVSRIVVSFVLAGICLPCVCLAKTTTWTGGSSGFFSVAGNWNNGAPASGDTCVFPASDVTLEHENFDLGSLGLTIENGATLNLHTTFSGTGGITKNGGGDLNLFSDTAGTFTGDVIINAGRLCIPEAGSVGGSKSFSIGKGKVVFTQESTSAAFLYENLFGPTFSNDIELQGSSSNASGALQMTQKATLAGDITSLCDFSINIGYCPLTISGDVSAPGKTLTATSSASSSNVGKTWQEYQGVINACFVKRGKSDVILRGRSDFLANTLRVEAHTNVIASTGYWGGRTVEVDGNTSVLRLEGAQNLSPLSEVSLTNGGRLLLTSSCAVRISKFVVAGEVMPSGTYSASSLPLSISGDGTLTVAPLDKMWTGGASGKWSDEGNWSGSSVPESGQLIWFPGDVTLEKETVDVGTGGFIIVSDATITSHVWFTGEGGLVKRGSGRFVQVGEAGGDFAGGVRFEGGVLSLDNRRQDPAGSGEDGYKFFGTGPVTLVSSSAYRPYIDYNEWNCGLTNQIVISGENLGDNQQGAFYVHQKVDLAVGPIVADSDFKIYQSYYGIQFSSISAPGHTVFVDSYRSTYNVMVTLGGTVNANVTKTGNFGPLTIAGSSSNPANVMTLPSGTNTFSAAARWAGALTVSGDKTLVRLQGANNLSAETALTVSGGARLEISTGVRVAVKSLVLDGVKKDDGIYTAQNLPSLLTGAGRLKVGTTGLLVIVR